MQAYKLYKVARKHYLRGNTKLADIITKLNNFLHNSHIPHTASIGENCEFAYGGIGVVLHDKSVLGKNCMIGQNCTIGGRKGHGGPPIIGDNVYIAAGARLIGSFKIGNNVIIGANSVVLTDIPDNCVVAGVPAKIIKSNVNM